MGDAGAIVCGIYARAAMRVGFRRVVSGSDESESPLFRVRTQGRFALINAGKEKYMKKLTLGLMAVLVLCLGFGAAAFAKPEYDLKLQTYYSTTNSDHVRNFAKEVNEKSKGRIKITVYSGGELVSTPNVIKAVRGGMIDMGVTSGGQFTELTMGNIEGGLPMAWLSTAEADQLFDKDGLLELVAADYAKHGVKYLNTLWNAQYTILSKRPINSLDDLRKMKIRAISGSAKMLQSLGVSTVNMPPEDVYLGLSTGQIDGTLYGAPFEYEINKFYEVAPYILMTPILNPITDGVFIRQDLWDGMDKECRDALLAAAHNLRYAYYNFGLEKDKVALDTIFKGKQTTLPVEDIATMTKAAVAVWDEEAKVSPNTAKAVELIKENARRMGRIQ